MKGVGLRLFDLSGGHVVSTSATGYITQRALPDVGDTKSLM
jgi:hypothetical protein